VDKWQICVDKSESRACVAVEETFSLESKS